MPLIAIVVGLAASIWWGLVLLPPLIGVFVVVMVGAQALVLFTKDSFTPGDALGTVAHDKARVLSFFGLAQAPKGWGREP